jgi:hypothetical protein
MLCAHLASAAVAEAQNPPPSTTGSMSLRDPGGPGSQAWISYERSYGGGGVATPPPGGPAPKEER